MTYAQDTITDVNAANVFVSVLDGLLTGAGWTTVETLTPSGNFRNRIYKSSGASNICGYDWYVAISWTVVGTENYVRVLAAESYDPGTHTLAGICGAQLGQGGPTSNHSYKSTQPTTGYTSPSTLNMATATITTTQWQISAWEGESQWNSYAPGFQTLIPSSSFAYWMSVTLDHVAAWTTVASNVQHAAFSTLSLDTDYAASALFSHTPIVDFSLGSFEMSSNMLGVAINATSHTYLATSAEFSGVYGAKLPFLTDTYLDAYAWKPYVYLTYMKQGTGNPIPSTQIIGGIAVGVVPDMYLVWGGTIGDTIEIDSATYVLTGPLLSNESVDTRPTVAVLVE